MEGKLARVVEKTREASKAWSSASQREFAWYLHCVAECTGQSQFADLAQPFLWNDHERETYKEWIDRSQ